jgi:hypothetical protein
MKRTLLIAAVLGAIGCGGSSGNTGTTHVYASGGQVSVPAGSCDIVAGPEDVGNGSMYFAVDPLYNTSVTVAIIPDSFFLTYGCNFTPSETLYDNDILGPTMETITDVVAMTYDFVAVCGTGGASSCAFDLTWTATY